MREAPGQNRPLKVAIVHPRLAFGGSEAPVVWAAEALKKRYAVSLITGGDVSLKTLNEYYGTALETGQVSLVTVPFPSGLGGTNKFAGLRWRFVQRFVKRLAPEYDVLIGGYNPCDFGKPGIQYVADFSFMYEWRTTLDPALQGWRSWWYGDTLLRNGYDRLCDYICPIDPGAWGRNHTLATSGWCAELLDRRLGLPARVLYPPVSSGFPAIPWERREQGFVCIGRVVREKRIDMAIRILRNLRAKGHDIHLHILGSLDDSPFGKRLQALCAENSGWVRLEGRVYEKQKKELIAAHRFGIHARENEAFGIAPAEMIKGGCITFVPKSGGQTEIVNHPALVYNYEEEAAAKIEAVLASVSLQNALREHLSEQAPKFSVESFKRGMRKAVIRFLATQRATPYTDIPLSGVAESQACPLSL